MRKYNPIEPKNEVAIYSVGKAAKYILIGFLLIIISMSAFSISSTNTFKSATEIHKDRLTCEINPEFTIKDDITRTKNETLICETSNTPNVSGSNTNNPTFEYIEFLSVTRLKRSDNQKKYSNFTNNTSVSVQISYSIEIPK